MEIVCVCPPESLVPSGYKRRNLTLDDVTARLASMLLGLELQIYVTVTRRHCQTVTAAHLTSVSLLNTIK